MICPECHGQNMEGCYVRSIGKNKLDYFAMLPRCAALNPIREDELLAMIGKEVAVPMRDGSNFFPYLVKPLL